MSPRDPEDNVSATVSVEPRTCSQKALLTYRSLKRSQAGSSLSPHRRGRLGYQGVMARSPQTLSETERRVVAAWAADCAARVLPLFEAAAPDDGRPRALIARTRAFARGEVKTADAIRERFAGGVPAGDAPLPAAYAAARAAGQAVAVCHMGAHALGAAAYAVTAVGHANPDRPEAVRHEIDWQYEHMSTDVRAALRQLPVVGQNRSGPLGPGQLASGQLGAAIAALQDRLGCNAADEIDRSTNVGRRKLGR